MDTPAKNCSFCAASQKYRHTTAEGTQVFELCLCRFGVKVVMTDLKLPAKGPVHVSEDGDALVITIPSGGQSGDTTERCDRIAKNLLALPTYTEKREDLVQFKIETGEPAFVANRIRNRVWGNIAFVHYVGDTSPQTRDIPGPFLISVQESGASLTLLVEKANRSTTSG